MDTRTGKLSMPFVKEKSNSDEDPSRRNRPHLELERPQIQTGEGPMDLACYTMVNLQGRPLPAMHKESNLYAASWLLLIATWLIVLVSR